MFSESAGRHDDFRVFGKIQKEFLHSKILGPFDFVPQYSTGKCITECILKPTRYTQTQSLQVGRDIFRPMGFGYTVVTSNLEVKIPLLPIFFFFSRDHSVLWPLFRTAGHLVRTQHGVTASAGQRRGDVEVRRYLRDQAGSRSLVVFDLSITHDRFGSSSHVQQNGSLSHPQDLDGPMRVAAQRKTNAYKQTYADNQNISFLPAIMSTSNRIHGEFLRLLFLQAHRETEAHFTAAGMPSQRN
jgi:hypothetical protein